MLVLLAACMLERVVVAASAESDIEASCRATLLGGGHGEGG
jgi:hypothetical protein